MVLTLVVLGKFIGITYEILDGDENGVVWVFGTGYIPHNVVIDHNMTLYKESVLAKE